MESNTTDVESHQDKRQDAPCSDFSIIIGLVSTQDRGRIFETLESLRNQQGSYHYEVIIADRRLDDVSSQIDARYPEVQRITCPPEMSLPALRTIALEQASGTYIVVTEDHCVPANDWLNSFAEAFKNAPAGTVAAGGCVENGVTDTALDWATFLCEYSFFIEPVSEGNTTVLPGMNIAYRQSVFEGVDADLLNRGFWETTLHPTLIEKGFKLYSSNKIRVYHCKKIGFGQFVRQRYVYSRYYAGLRFSRRQRMKRLLACITTILLPPVLVFRSLKQLKSKNRLRNEFRSSLPILIVFYLVWAYGEMVGYMLGSGNALARIE